MIKFLDNLFGGFATILVEFFNGLVVGLLSFVDGVLTSLERLEGLVVHFGDSLVNFFASFTGLGHRLFPFLPVDWLALIEAALVILAVGLIVKKRVIK